MMREQVGIILNEREPAKAQAAAQLEALLYRRNITSFRIALSEDLLERATAHSPELLILDYVLGDWATGLDLLALLKERNCQSSVIFLTDEPGVSVAVEALQQGAAGYFDLSTPLAVEKTAAQAAELLLAKRRLPARLPAAPLKLDELVAHAPLSRQLLKEAQLIVAAPVPIILVCGPSGAGLTAWSNALLAACSKAALSRRIDLRRPSASLAALFGLALLDGSGLRLGKNLSLLIDHAEEDTGELLDYTAAHFEQLWPGWQGGSFDGRLIICSSKADDAARWRRLLPVEVLKVPDLAERGDDIPALARHFADELSRFSSKRSLSLAPKTVKYLQSLEWPQHVRQLRAVVQHALWDLIAGSCDPLESIELARCAWATEHSSGGGTPFLSRWSAAAILEQAGGNYRVAAARAGCSVSALYAAIKALEEGHAADDTE